MSICIKLAPFLCHLSRAASTQAVLIYIDYTIGCPKVRVEISTLARGARACIESTQFIINRVDSMHARAPRARENISTRTFGQPMIIPKVGNYISTDEYTTSAKRKILRTRK